MRNDDSDRLFARLPAGQRQEWQAYAQRDCEDLGLDWNDASALAHRAQACERDSAGFDDGEAFGLTLAAAYRARLHAVRN
jgi:hypothetical protein